jgi:dynein heavy chain
VQTFWARFVDRVDEKVEDALRVAVKRSLQEMSRAINGEGKSKDISEVQPLFKVNVVLENQKVEFSPPLQKLEEEVNGIARYVTIFAVNYNNL